VQSQLLLVILYALPTPPGEHHGFRAENFELPPFAVVAERADDALAVLEQREDANFHVHIDAAMDSAILQRANHLQSGPVADVREAWIFVSAEIALKDAAIGRAVEDGAPGFQFAHAVGRLAGVQFRHSPVVDVLPAAQGVGEVDFPTVTFIHVGQRRRDAAFRHDGVGFAQKTFADHAHGDARGGGFDCGAQTGAAGADDQHVMLEGWIVGHELFAGWGLRTAKSGFPF